MHFLHTQIYLGEPRVAQKRGSSPLRPICKSTDGRCKGKKSFSHAKGGFSYNKPASSSAEGEISKCQELDGKSLSKKRSQGRGEQRCVRDKKLCLGGNTEVAQKSRIWVSRRDFCARHLMYSYPSQPPRGMESGLWLQQGGERKSFATIHHICVE